jgi:hypothetical protein
MWGKSLTLGGAATLVSFVACGGSSSGGGGGTCSTFTACGGDIVGTWVTTSGCVQVTGTIASGRCVIDVNETDSEISAVETFNPDGTYTSEYSASESDVFTINPPCFSTSDAPIPCDQAAEMLDMGAPVMSGTIAPWACSQGPSGRCICQTSVTVSKALASGTYATDGSTLTETPTCGVQDVDRYCVTGASELHVSPGSGLVFGLATATTSGYVAFAKQ